MHIQFSSLCWDLTVVFSLPRHPECDQWQANIKNRLYVCFFPPSFFKKLFSAQKTVASCSQCLHLLLWFSHHYLLIKVENNSPGPGHLFNDKPHSSVWSACRFMVRLQRPPRFSTLHFILFIYAALINVRSEGKPLYLMCECIWGGFILPTLNV